MKNILAIDSSGKTAGVSVLCNNELVFDTCLDLGLTHSETLLALVTEAFSSCNLHPKDISCYAITSGPGSFTGLRIGMALVKGLALPYNTEVMPVSTLEALAAACPEQGIVIPALDARRGEVYWAAFSKTEKLQRLTEDSAGPINDIGKILTTVAEPVIFIGDGAEMCYTMYNPSASTLQKPVARSISYGASLIAASQTSSKMPANQMQPSYIRIPQAERERMNRLSNISI